MTTTSGNPDNLDHFVSKPVQRREAFAGRLATAISTQSAVSSASITHGVRGTHLGLATTLVADMLANEEFVRAVRDALLHADRLDGVATVNDSAIAVRLASGDYATDRPEYEMPVVAMIGAPANSGFVDDPICAANGNFILVETDLTFPALTGVLEIERWYNSLAADRVGVFGAGWSCVLDMSLTIEPGSITARLDDGAAIEFTSDDSGGWTTIDRRRHGLVAVADERDGFILRRVDAHRRTWTFDAEGALTGWTLDGSRVAVVRDAEAVVALRSEASGRVVRVETGDRRIVELGSDDGRVVSYGYDADVLRTVRSASTSTDYESVLADAGALLVSAVDADGVAEFLNVFDDLGRVVMQTSPFGRVTSYLYDVPGTTVITDEADVRQAMVHDVRGNLTAVVDVDGSAMRISYDSLGRAVEIVDRLGNATTNEFDGTTDRLARRVHADGSTETWSWDEPGRVTSHTACNGSRTTSVYDDSEAGQDRAAPVAVWRDGVQIVSAELDSNGQVVSVTDADGVQVRHEYDRDGQLRRSIDADGQSTSSRYDDRGLLVEVVDEIGTAIEMLHDDAGRLAVARLGDVETTFGYTAAGRVAHGSEPGGHAWSVDRGSHGSVTAFRDPGAAEVGFEHDTHGHIVATIAPDGSAYRRTFTATGLPLSMSDPTGATWTVAYDRAGRQVSQTDALGNTMTRTIDARGQATSITAADGATSHFTYHVGGGLASVTLADGRTWSIEINSEGRPTAITDPDGRRAERSYTPAGRLSKRVSPAGRIEQYEYDRCGRLVSTDRDGHRAVRRYDARSLLVSVDDSRTGTQRFEWDAHRRLVGRQVGEQGATVLKRNANGQVVGVIDGTGATTRFEFDGRGLLAAAVDAAGLTTRFEHDIRGRLTAQTAPGGRRTTWQFDEAGRPSGFVDPAGVVTSLERNANGRIARVQRGSAGFDRHLDRCGRELRRTLLDGDDLVGFDRDVCGRIVSATGIDTDLTVDFLWDSADHLQSATMHHRESVVTRDDDGVPTGTQLRGPDDSVADVRYIRDASGAVVGAMGDDIAPVVHRQRDGERDAAGRLLAGADGTLYRYDGAGRLSERSVPGRGTTLFTYDETGLIATETSPTGRRAFGYDAAGRVAEVVVDGSVATSFTYDDAGRRSSAAGSDGSVTRFDWSPDDHLAAIERVSADGVVHRVEIEVDGLGRPVRVDGIPVSFDPLTGRPSRIGERAVVHAGALRWDSEAATWTSQAAGEDDGLEVAGIRLLGQRAFDPATHQFLTADPLFTVPGTNGASSAYTFCWHDPVNFVDPSGLQPISVEDYDAIVAREEQGAVVAVGAAIAADPWGYAGMALVVVAGAALTAFPATSAIGVGILVGVTTSTAMTVATGAEFDPTMVAFNGLLGGATLGYGSAAASAGTGLGTMMAVNGGIGIAGSAGQQIIQNNGFDNFDLSDLVLTGGVTAATVGVGSKLVPGGTVQAFAQGAGVDMAGETVMQVFDSQPGVSLPSIVGAGVNGGVFIAFEFHVDSAPPDFVGAPNTPSDPRPTTFTVEAPPTVVSINATNVSVAGPDGTRMVVDHHVTMSDGSHAYVEVRPQSASPARDGSLPVTDNQSTVIPHAADGTAVAVGGSAAGIYEATGAGPLGPTTVQVVPHGTTIEVGSPIDVAP